MAAVSSNIDDKTIHELYLWPFQDAVLAGSVAIMCSYERINNSYACQNSKTLNGLLKTELGFQGEILQHGLYTTVSEYPRLRDYRLGSPAWWNRLGQCWFGHGNA